MNLVKKNVQHQVLDPCLLGRPVHRLPAFAAQLKEDLSQAMRLNMNRRYWGTFQVDSVEFSRLDGTEARARWLNFGAPSGDIAFALERKVLLAVLNYRYGRSKSDGSLDDTSVKVTATEDRLAVVLGQQLAGTLAGRIEANLPRPGKAEDTSAEKESDFHAEPGKQPPKGTWVVTVSVSDHDTGGKPPLSGRFWFALDKQLMTSVLHGLSPERDGGRRAAPQQAPLASRLQVHLKGILVTKEVMLGNLFDLRIGDVMPISMHRADVLLDDSRLFTAAVSEHKGKICLTSFEDVE